MRKLLFVLLLAVISCYCHAQGRDTFSVYFDLGSAELNKTAIKRIDSLVYNDVLAPRQKVGIIGYADIVGGEQANQVLSAKRAQAVKRYLLRMSIDTADIEWVTANGEVSRIENETGYPQDRRVAIIPGGFKKTAAKYKKPITKGQRKLGDIITYNKDIPVIDIDQIDVNSLFKLDKVYFTLGKSDLLKQSTPMLTALYNMMRDNPRVRIQIEGHVCCAAPYDIVNGKREPYPEGKIDTTAFTALEDLSVYRSAAVFWFLKNKGIAKERMRYIGYGTKKMLIKPELTEEDRAANRRVEVRILAK